MFAGVAAIPIGIVAVLVVRAVGFTPADRPVYANLRLRGRARLLARKLVGWAESGLVFLAGFHGRAPVRTGGRSRPLARDRGDRMGGNPISDARPQAPAVTFHRDPRLVCVKALAGGAAPGAAFGVQDALLGGSGLAVGLSIEGVVAVAIALGVGLHQFRRARLQDRLASGLGRVHT